MGISKKQMSSPEAITERLLRLDEDASLVFDDNSRFVCILVGGSALILMGYISRATHDIDLLRVPAELQGLLAKYDMNSNVSAHMDNFPDDYPDRVHKLDLDTEKIDFYTLSLEDLVVSKLAAGRERDVRDIENRKVVEEIDWEQLSRSAEMVKLGMLSERAIREFEDSYEEYVRRFRP